MIQFDAFIGSRCLCRGLCQWFSRFTAHAAFSVAFIAASVDGSLGSRCLCRACKLLVSETYA